MHTQALYYLLATPGPGTATLEWTEEACTAFDAIKDHLATAALLNHPQPDASTRVMADASSNGAIAVPQQCIDDIWKPLAISSKTGALQPSHDCRNILTFFDRFTRWPEVDPMRDMSAETLAKAFLQIMDCTLRSTVHHTTEHGRQFESFPFNELFTSFKPVVFAPPHTIQ